ncbi:MAG TPA: hypothetical protein VKW08_00400 [Xanthobacteraceae bacterium]|jgi:hypothetical protein|nr:hypothetical protein [Xanthobacteraceae bacterium]
MRSYSVRILANNEAGTWQSWPAKIAAIKAFYASVCDLDITVTPTKLTPQFAPYQATSGNGTIYQVDETWYAQNVVPLAAGADIVMFFVPPTDHTVPCLIGLEAGHSNGPWETTVFTDETSHTYVLENGTDVDQGETSVVYAEHELSHVFYAMLTKTDNTHPYFFAGTPEKVLADFDFDEQELSWYQQVIQDLEKELELLKARQIPPIGDPKPLESQNSVSPTSKPTNPVQPSFPSKITTWAAIIAKEEGANPTSNNPGNLKYSDLTAGWGATQGNPAKDGGYLCHFATAEAGLTALCNFLVLGCEDQLIAFHQARTLAEFTKVYAGNPPQGYIDAIVQAMGGDPNVQISTFLS